MTTKSFKVFLDGESEFDTHMKQAAKDYWQARIAAVGRTESMVSALQWATRTPIHRVYRLLAALGIKY